MNKKLLLTFLCGCLLWACSSENGIIPERVMAKIYRDIYLTDQYISTSLQSQQAADTLRVYESICNKYGYTSADFVHSVNHHLQQPATFADLLKPAYAELKKKENELEKEIARLENLNTRWPLLDTLSKLADKRLRGNTYYRALYQLFYQPKTLVYHAPLPDTASLNAPWSNLLLYTSSIFSVTGHIPYYFGVEWAGMDPELINDPYRWNFRETLPRWYLLERDYKDSIKVVQDSIRREQQRIKRVEDSLRREKRREEVENIRKKNTPNPKNAKNTMRQQPTLDIKDRHQQKIVPLQKEKRK